MPIQLSNPSSRDFGDIAPTFAWRVSTRLKPKLARLAAAEAVRNNWLRRMSDLQRNEAWASHSRRAGHAIGASVGLSRESTALDSDYGERTQPDRETVAQDSLSGAKPRAQGEQRSEA